MIERSAGRLLAFVNFSAMGQIDPHLGEYRDPRYLIAERAAEVVRAGRQRIVGAKVRLTESLSGPNALLALDRTIEAGEAAGVPVMAHIGDSTTSTDQIMQRLRADDIVTHAFTDGRNGIFDDHGRVHAAAIEARARGVRFDVGHAHDRSPSHAPRRRSRRASGRTPSAPTCDQTQFHFARLALTASPTHR